MEQTNAKKAALVLIAKFFGLTLKEAKDQAESLTMKDREELASAIARQQGLPQEECNFKMVDY